MAWVERTIAKIDWDKLAELTLIYDVRSITNRSHVSIHFYAAAVADNVQLLQHKWKKNCSEASQTLRAGCSKVEPKIFTLLQTPFPGAWDGQNLISWRQSLPSPTDKVWWRSMHTISSYRDNRPTDKQTDRGDYNTLRSFVHSVKTTDSIKVKHNNLSLWVTSNRLLVLDQPVVISSVYINTDHFHTYNKYTSNNTALQIISYQK